jgi:hypothetical protein
MTAKIGVSTRITPASISGEIRDPKDRFDNVFMSVSKAKNIPVSPYLPHLILNVHLEDDEAYIIITHLDTGSG